MDAGLQVEVLLGCTMCWVLLVVCLLGASWEPPKAYADHAMFVMDSI